MQVFCCTKESKAGDVIHRDAHAARAAPSAIKVGVLVRAAVPIPVLCAHARRENASQLSWAWPSASSHEYLYKISILKVLASALKNKG